MKIKTITSLLVSFCSIALLNAQQQGQSSLYFYNQHFYNPAYISINKGLTFVTNGRNQWVNFNGAPKTANVSVYSSIGNNLATGFSAQVDKIGATQTTMFIGNFGYEVSFKKKNIYRIKILESRSSKKDLNRISFGLSLGTTNYQTFYNRLKANDTNEEIFQDGFSYSQTTMNVGFGLMYYNSNRFIGFSIPKLLNNSISKNHIDKSKEEVHLYLVGGFTKNILQNITVRPACVLKYTKNSPISVDINLSFLLKERLWIGGHYKNNPAVGINFMYIVSTMVKLGYAYEQQFTIMNKYTSGTHEISLNLNFPSKKKKNGLVSCPKF